LGYFNILKNCASIYKVEKVTILLQEKWNFLKKSNIFSPSHPKSQFFIQKQLSFNPPSEKTFNNDFSVKLKGRMVLLRLSVY